MTKPQKKFISKTLTALIVINTVLFIAMALAHRLSTDSRAAVFVDFWGRFTVYSLWFIGFTVYVRYLSKTLLASIIVMSVVCLNIPLFLLLAYYNKISNSAEMIVYVDFWGRITVYSLWVICYEFYKNYIAE